MHLLLHVLEGLDQDLLLLLENLSFGPEELLEVLHPFEVRDGDSASAGKDVGDQEDALVPEDLVGFGGGGGAGALDDERGRYGGGGGAGQHGAHGRGDQDVAVLGPYGGGIKRLAARETRHGALVPPRVGEEGGHVQALGPAHRPGLAGHGHHPRTHPIQSLRRKAAHVAEALEDHPGALQLPTQHLRPGLPRAEGHAHARGGLAALTAPQLDGLAGDAGGLVAVLAAVLIHHPGHGLGIGVHVRLRDIAGGAQHHGDLGNVTAGEHLQLVLGHLRGITLDAPHGAAEGDVHHGGLPGHEAGQGPHFVQIQVRMKADAALLGAAHAVVLHAIPLEYFQGAIVHADGHGDGDLPVGDLEQLPDLLGKAQDVGGLVELAVHVVVEVHGPGHGNPLRAPGLAAAAQA